MISKVAFFAPSPWAMVRFVHEIDGSIRACAEAIRSV